jgi:hypothetical protein
VVLVAWRIVRRVEKVQYTCLRLDLDSSEHRVCFVVNKLGMQLASNRKDHYITNEARSMAVECAVALLNLSNVTCKASSIA